MTRFIAVQSACGFNHSPRSVVFLVGCCAFDTIPSAVNRTYQTKITSEMSGVEYFGEEREEEGGKKSEKSSRKHELKLQRAANRDEFSGLSRKQKRNKMARQEMDELPPQQARQQKAAAKSAKKEYHAKRQGFLPKNTRKALEEKKAKKAEAKPKKQAGAGGTFANDAHKPSLKRKRAEREPAKETKKPFRKKGKDQFKSKKKFKRR